LAGGHRWYVQQRTEWTLTTYREPARLPSGGAAYLPRSHPGRSSSRGLPVLRGGRWSPRSPNSSPSPRRLRPGSTAPQRTGRELLPPPRPGDVVGEGPEAQFVKTRFVHRVVAHLRFLGGEVHARASSTPLTRPKTSSRPAEHTRRTLSPLLETRKCSPPALTRHRNLPLSRLLYTPFSIIENPPSSSSSPARGYRREKSRAPSRRCVVPSRRGDAGVARQAEKGITYDADVRGRQEWVYTGSTAPAPPGGFE
jgi:hypothetical protein